MLRLARAAALRDFNELWKKSMTGSDQDGFDVGKFADNLKALACKR
jgi:hypothetical protein